MADFRARMNTYLVREEKRTRQAWHPQIRVNGKWLYLGDDSSPSRLKEAPDEETAVEQAIAALREHRGRPIE